MIQQFKEGAVSFRYPSTWQLEREKSASGWTVSLQSPRTAFLVVSYDSDMPRAEEMAEAALKALRSDYPELEVEACVDSLAGQMAVGHEMHFFSFDLTNTCWTRSLYSENGTLLVLWQANDLDLDEYEPILRAICASLQVTE